MFLFDLPNHYCEMSEEKVVGKKRSRKKLGGCYHCGAKDHKAKHCPNVVCRLCGILGHDAGGCAKKAKRPVDMGTWTSTKDNSVGFTFIELFAGVGGFRIALDKLGGHCVFASEIDRFCVKNYESNFGGDRPAGNICEISSDKISPADLLVGGFPCQPFSSSGSMKGLDDPRGQLFREIVRLLQDLKPKGFILENVRGLLLHNNGETLKVILKELEKNDYKVKYKVIDAAKILPQERSRLYFVGVRSDLYRDEEYQFPNIPSLNRGVEDILHRPEEIETIKHLALNSNQLNKVKSQKYTKEFPEARFLSDLKVPAKTIQSSYSKYMVGSQFVPMDGEWRRFSHREVARLQGFPESFSLCKDRAYHMIGNAVAPPLIAIIAASLLQYTNIISDQRERLGWDIATSMLMDACPEDRKKVLQEAFEKIKTN